MTLLVFPFVKISFLLGFALPGYGSSNGLELVGMTRMETLDGAPNASQLVLQALDLVEDDWCLGSFMNLEAGSSAQALDLVEDDWCLGSFMNLEAGSGAQVGGG
ncbi:uncharacterized protein BX664DRAFT_386104 [Halteromyces radiatus]|uniref:uncharacterized protein n=1 Tax=Halteromyces radiatus TaxID=101107 RepID=UPI002220B4A9|nr:uncharacterized protein BX664DRAFT_389710 [Halteromyces radiatus]XP_051400488.1 uncharacterized protein BX664DRAFT_386104 [Halteromyces radiatus]KAI8075974.1 hypothetical protein BX664DRAFT_389710 [Halteromyces radiatus]KAI8089646.1 hypothetical protein BX664DRAFT_386104 [Halteromyces radiatus]